MNTNRKTAITQQHHPITASLDRCLHQAKALALAQRARLDATATTNSKKTGEQP
jgi:hypothetical protein